MRCDTHAIAGAAQELFLARLAALVQVEGAAPPHDPGNLGGGWWTQYVYREDGSRYYGGERHALSTAAEMRMGGRILIIGLHYHIRTVAP